MRKEILGLVGILGLSGCTGKVANSPVEKAKADTLVGTAISDGMCYTRISVYRESSSSLEFDLEFEKDGGLHEAHVAYSRGDWMSCDGFPMVSAKDKVRLTGHEMQGSSIVVRYPEGIMRNLSSDSRYGRD